MKFRKIISLVLVVVCLVSVNGVPILSSVDTEGIDIQDNSVIAKNNNKIFFFIF